MAISIKHVLRMNLLSVGQSVCANVCRNPLALTLLAPLEAVAWLMREIQGQTDI